MVRDLPRDAAQSVLPEGLPERADYRVVHLRRAQPDAGQAFFGRRSHQLLVFALSALALKAHRSGAVREKDLRRVQ